MQLRHRTEHEKISGCRYLYILHRSHYRGNAITVVGHHRATVDKITTPLTPCHTMRLKNVAQQETLRSACYERTSPFRYGERGAFCPHNKSFCCRHAGYTATGFSHCLQIIRYCLLRYQRAHTVVNEYNRIVCIICNLLGGAKTVINRLLPRLSTCNDTYHFVYFKLSQHLVEKRNPVFQAYNDYRIYIGMIVKQFQCIHYDRFPVKFKKLLRPRFRVHPLTGATGKYQSYIFHFCLF